MNQNQRLALLLASFASIAGGQTVQLASEECQDLFTGEAEPFTKVGQVCPRIENGVIYFEVTSDEPYNLEETHICNLPYTSPGDLHTRSYTIEIPEEDAIEMVCGFDETEYLVAGHATTYDTTIRGAETFTSYFQVPLTCSEVLLAGSPEGGLYTPPGGDLVTAFGYIQNNNYCFPNRLKNPGENCAVCFSHYTSLGTDGGEYRDHHRWGWVLGGFEKTNQYYRMIGQPQRSYNGELYAHAADCNTNAGEMIGTFKLDYREIRRKVVVTLEALPGWILMEAHVHISNDENNILPKDNNGNESLLPRYYTASHEQLGGGQGVKIDRFEINSRRTMYAIVHVIGKPEV